MGRYEELDSIRGLAAMSVVFSHCLAMLAYFQSIAYFDVHDLGVSVLKFTPLSILVAGHEAVILFFVLSGLVLSLPYFTGKQISYKKFIIKRVFRLYIPYMFVIFSTIFLRQFMNAPKTTGMSDWFNEQWQSPVTFTQILNHIVFLPSYTYGGGRYDIAAFNSVIWSLIHEMRISIIFPLLMILIIRLKWKGNLLIALASSLFYLFSTFVDGHVLPHVLTTLIPYANTLEWLPMFIVGALIGKNLKAIRAFLTTFSSGQRALVFIAGLITYTYPFWVFQRVKVLHVDIINDWMTLAGACIFIVLAMTSGLFSKILLSKFIHHIGKISYSLYLWHVLVLLVLYHSLNAFTPLWVIWIAAIALSLIIGTLSYKYIELPSITLGRKLSRLVVGNRQVPIRNVEKSPQQSI